MSRGIDICVWPKSNDGITFVGHYATIETDTDHGPSRATNSLCTSGALPIK